MKISHDKDDTKLASELLPFVSKSGVNVFDKKYNYSALKASDLRESFKQRSIEKLVICGIDTDARVLATAFEAYDLGFSTSGLDDEALKIVARKLVERN